MKKLFMIFAGVICVLLIAAVCAIGLRTANDKYVADSYPLKYEDEVEAAAKKYKVDKFLVYGVIKTESNFDPDARSSVGAIGLMQLMTDTFDWIQTYYVDEDYKKYTVKDLDDPAVNIDYGTHLLSILLDMYEVEDTALCAYNAGVGNVDSWLADKKYSDDGKTLKKVPISETESYRHLVQQNKSCYQRIYGESSETSEK